MAVHQRTAADAVEHQGAEADLGLGAELTPAQQGACSRLELGQIEGLHEIVVGTAIQPDDPIANGIAGGEDQHRCAAAPTPQTPQHFQTVHARQAEIENDEIVILPGERCIARSARVHTVDPVAGAGEGALDPVAEHRVVLDDEYPHAPDVSLP